MYVLLYVRCVYVWLYIDVYVLLSVSCVYDDV